MQAAQDLLSSGLVSHVMVIPTWAVVKDTPAFRGLGAASVRVKGRAIVANAKPMYPYTKTEFTMVQG